MPPLISISANHNLLVSSFKSLPDRWNSLQILVPERDNALEMELSKQQRNEQLRAQFAIQANKLGPWLERALDAFLASRNNLNNTSQLEQQLAGLRKNEEELEKMKSTIVEAERCYQVQLTLVFLTY